MATDTLGARILWAADHLVDRMMNWSDGRIADANDDLRALAARADAAERLAKAVVRWNGTPTASPTPELWDALIESQEAEAAWKAIEESEVTT